MRDYRELVATLGDSLDFLSIVDAENVVCDGHVCDGYRDAALFYADDDQQAYWVRHAWHR